MKKGLIIIMLCLSIIYGCKDNSFQVSGKLENPVAGDYLYFDKLMTTDLETIDSVKLDNDGTFSFKGDIDYPVFYLLRLTETNFMTILVEPGEDISITASADSLNIPLSVTGSPGTLQMTDYNIRLKKAINELGNLNEIYNQNIDNPQLPAIIEQLDSTAQVIINEMNIYTKNYIDSNISSLVSLVALYQQIAPGVYILNAVEDARYFEKVDSSLISLYPDSEPVKALHEQVKELLAGIDAEMASALALGTGAEAPEIALPTPEGDTIKLTSSRGKIVLLDFWAAWCSPCRLENPNLVAAYNKYHSRGFEIFQVSLDRTKEDWIKGIEDDGLGRWIHVSDVKYWNSVVVPLYSIEGIPYNFLLDKEGKIIASNLRGEALQTKLAEIFN